MDVRRRLDVDGDAVGAGLDELGDLTLGALDHQVHVDDRPGGVHLVGERLDDVRAERDRRHEVAVHHVDVDHPRAGGEHLADLRARASQDRPTRIDGAICREWITRALSMLPWQWLHCTIAVVDMRTIVECSPQLGQTD